MIKRTLKFTLCALLLGVSASAFAQNEAPKVVTLKDGTSKVSWEDFVSVLNKEKTPTVSETIDTGLKNAQIAFWGVDGTFVEPTNISEGVPSARLDSIQKANAYTEASSTYTNATSNLNLWTGQLSGLSSEKQTPEWLTRAYTNAQAFEGAYDDYDPDDADSFTNKSTMFYAYKTNSKDKTKYDLYLSFGDTKPADGQGFTNSKWESINAKQYFDDIVIDDDFKVAALYIYYGSDFANASANTSHNPYEKVTWTSTYSKSDLLTLAVESVESLYNNTKYEVDPNASERLRLQNLINGLTTTPIAETNPLYEEKYKGKTLYEVYLLRMDAAKTAADTAKTTAETKLRELQAAERAYASAENAARTNYDKVTLTGDIKANTQITEEFKGDINANGYTINISIANDDFLFSNFANGHLENAIINGKFAARGSYSDVAVWRGINGTYYDDLGNNIGTITSIGELGFKIRDNFGVLFSGTDSKLTNLKGENAKNKVYSLDIYDSPSATEPSQNYVTYNGTEFNGKDGKVEVPVNKFAKSATSDIQNLTNVTNVFYVEGGVNKCQKVVVTDKVSETSEGKTINAASFYCPVELKANEVTYNRTFDAGNNTVCLPFDLTASSFSSESVLSTFSLATKEKFWFTRTQTLAANTPGLIVAPEGGATLNTLTATNGSAITIKATPKDQLIMNPKDEGKINQSWGTFTRLAPGAFAPENESGYKVFGWVTSSKNFRPAGDGAMFPAFRMVVYCGDALESTAGAPSMRSVGILDEFGNDITSEIEGTSAVESINADGTSSLNIVGGQGAIEFTAAADYGKVKVYNVNGGLVTVANVMEGTTRVNVEKGIYIVMGKKVMVK